ncbi:hypothetical protein HT031_002102 [Scenedesmus sp. PABB004]|nr:hypothetical protein HT031_002102 [Scenedesmus sp. PABB004]
MSVVAQSPFTSGKRLFEEQDASPAEGGSGLGLKRARFDSPSGRCRGGGGPPGQQQQQCRPHPSAVAALKALFPDMDEQAVESVLAECGQDIDAAIRRLTHLKLSNAEAVAAAANGGPPQHQQQQQQQPQQHAPRAAANSGGSDTAHVADDRQAAAAAAEQQQQQAQAQQAAAAAQAALPQTAEQWVDALVQEMAAAQDFADARGRAGKMLQAFEAFVSARAKDAPGGGAGRLDEALRENAILKRAVQIQNAKLQEAAAKDQELSGLKQVLGQYQERLRHLELSNYSLALHLQKATDDRSATANRPPDVF